jgi:hypothetical protein
MLALKSLSQLSFLTAYIWTKIFVWLFTVHIIATLYISAHVCAVAGRDVMTDTAVATPWSAVGAARQRALLIGSRRLLLAVLSWRALAETVTETLIGLFQQPAGERRAVIGRFGDGGV